MTTSVTSRVARMPIVLPKGVDITVNGQHVLVKGPKGEMALDLHAACSVVIEDGVLTVVVNPVFAKGNAQGGTARALLNNYVIGVTQGFSKKLLLVGVGYRAKAAQVANRYAVDLTLGFSHPAVYTAPVGIVLSTPTPTEILVEGCSKRDVGQVAAEIRAFREPEPYKGKGVRYSDEVIVLKETKKK